MRTFLPENTPTPELHQLLLGAVAPRPIAFASTIDEDGQPNLAPFSFFNAFSSNPPILVFSANRRVKGNTTKDTLHNCQQQRQVVVNIADYRIARQMALASVEYPPGISEFEKAGLTPLASDVVKPFRVAEAPVQFECLVDDIIPLGQEGGAGNLIICRVVAMHFAEHLFEEDKIDPKRCDFVARMGRAFYCRVIPESIFKMHQPVQELGMGFDGLPLNIRASRILTGRQLAELAAYPMTPDAAGSEVWHNKWGGLGAHDARVAAHNFAAEAIERGEIDQAWQALLWSESVA